MTGMMAIHIFQRLLDRCDELGFKMIASRHSGSYHDRDVVAITPKDKDALPIYSRDAEIFVGSIEELEYWLNGVTWARDYDRMLAVTDDKKRARKEQDYRNRELANLIKDSPG